MLLSNGAHNNLPRRCSASWFLKGFAKLGWISVNQDENLAKEEQLDFILFSVNSITAIIFTDKDRVLGKYFKWQSRLGSFKSSVCDYLHLLMVKVTMFLYVIKTYLSLSFATNLPKHANVCKKLLLIWQLSA